MTRSCDYLAHADRAASRRTTWVFRFGDDASYTIHFDRRALDTTARGGRGCVIVETSPDEWVKFLSADVEGRRRWLRSGAPREQAAP